MSDAGGILAAIKEGRATALSATETCLDRIAHRDAEVGAWAYVGSQQARRQAQALDTGAPIGALHGLPIGIKDVLLTKDMPTEYNCELYAENAPAIDAAAVTIMRQAGAVIVGKTETVELASIGKPPRTCNPHALDRTPGGSSSGSAAAVADGHVPVALGTQTGGSIIRPASFCGTWALKPTWGIVATEGAKQFAPSLDTIGWFARSPRDLTLMLDLFHPAEPVDGPELKDARIGIWRTGGWGHAEAATRDAMRAAVALLEAAGAKVDELEFPAPFSGLAAVHRTVMMAEGARSFLPEYRIAPEKLHPRIVEMVETGGGYSTSDLGTAYDVAAMARALFDKVAAEYDAILAPSTIGEAPQGLANTGDLLFNGLFTLLHVPCVNIPLWRAANGLPVGLTLTGPRFADHYVISVAEHIALSASTMSFC